MARIIMLAALAASPAMAQTQPSAPSPAIEQTHSSAQSSSESASEPGAAAQTGLEAWQAPTLTITRYDEHWTQFKDPESRDGHWTGPFKYISLGSQAWLTTGAEVRARSESYHENTWGSSPAPNDTYLWLRAMPYADLHVGEGSIGARVFAQPIIAYAVGVSSALGPTDQTRLDLLQGFADIRIGAETGSVNGYGATFRVGRQMVSLGTERLVGTRYGPNVPLAFDGVRGLLSFRGGILTLLSIRPVLPGPGTFDDAGSSLKRLSGAYLTLPKTGVGAFDFYALEFINKAAQFGGVSGREDRQTFGLRFSGTQSGWHWDVETMIQRGRFGDQKIRAWALGSDFGKSLATLTFKPDVDLRFNVISGDRKAGDGQLGTFNALFPKGKYFGELSPVGPVNIVSINPRVTATIAPRWTAAFAVMGYWRYAVADGVYGVPGNLVRAAGSSSARFIGKQEEGTIAWQASSELALSLSLSFFEAGKFIRDTGTSYTISMVGAEANFRF